MPLGETIGRAYIKILGDGSGFKESVRDSIDESGPEFEKGGEESSKKFWSKFRGNSKKEGKEHRKDVKRTLDDLKGDIERFGKSTTGVGNAIGKAFGRGSRNDFLNLFGGIISSLPRALGKLLEFTSGLKLFDTVMADSEGNLRGLGEAFGSLSKFAGPIVQLVAVGAMIQGLLAVMGIAGSAVSLLAGLVLALAGSLGFALVGALVAVGGALIPFGAAIGVVAIALSGLQKIGGDALKGLKTDWEKLQKSTARKIFGKDMGGLGAIRSVLGGVKPIIDAVASSLGGLLLYLGEATKSTGFQTLMQNIAAVIGPMVTQLGKIGGNLATFLGEAFVAAAPMIEEFLGWLLGVTQAMADFGKAGKGGKSPLSKFFEDAWGSAKIVLGLIGNIGEALLLLFSKGKGTGDSLFQSMSDAVGRLVTWLKDPKNGKALQQWFDDAKKLGEKIGEVVLAVIDLVDKLDTPGNREMLFAVLDVLIWIIDKFGDVMAKLGELNAKLLEGGKSVPGAWESVHQFFTTTVPGWFDTAITAVSSVPGRIAGFFTGLGTKIVAAAGDFVMAFSLWWAGVTAQAALIPGQIAAFFTGLASKIWVAAGDVAASVGTWLAGLPVAVIQFVGKVVVAFAGLAGKMVTAAGDIIGRFTQWLADLPGRSMQTVVNIIVGFTNLAIKIILAAGNLATRFATWVSTLPGKTRQLAVNIVNGMLNLATRMIVAAGNLASRFASWIASLPGKARTLATNIVNGMANLAGRMISKAGDIAVRFASWVRSLPGKATKIASDIANAFSGLASKAMAKAGSIVSAIDSWASGVYSAASGVASDIVRAFSGLAGDIVNAIGTIIPRISMPHINIPHITAIVDTPKAAGGIVDGARMALIGEAGPEAIVPLNRPLAQVDPAVRMLSAIAQGKVPGFASGGVAGGKSIDVGGITINTPTEDPRAVASEVVAHMAAATYI